MSSAHKKLCLNMIVKNEMANLPRCLSAVADHIACWVIGDTGSTDGTQDFIRRFFAARGLPGELHRFPFVNFGQARNEALERALNADLSYDYILFDDADMELVVDEPDFRNELHAPCYLLLQRASYGLTYWNVRLVRRDAGDAGMRYHGVTHEYLDLPVGTQQLHVAWYKDHASGSNRVDKFSRDARLLTEALRQDPDNARYWFYLAQSYRDGGKIQEAADAYAKRAEMGGWLEEAWQARLQRARCLRDLGDEGGFLSAALAAYNERPQRAEPLYDLARYYRTKGQNEASILFAERGLELPMPGGDILFIEDWIYRFGLKEEFSIAANHVSDPIHKDRGHAVCDWLALSRDAPKHTGGLARWNLFYYTKALSSILPSFEVRSLDHIAPDGFDLVSACVTCQTNKIALLLVTTRAGSGTNLRLSVLRLGLRDTRNFLLTLSSTLDIESVGEILPSLDMLSSAEGLSVSSQDTRLFSWHGALWYSAKVLELTPEGSRRQIMARIEVDGASESYSLTSWQICLANCSQEDEMNSLPPGDSSQSSFMPLRNTERMLSKTERMLSKTAQPVATGTFSPVTSAMAFDDGWLALIREARGEEKDRTYQHRFVWFNSANRLCQISRQFYFHDREAECATGITWHPDGQKLLIAYNVTSRSSSIASIRADELRGFMGKI